MTPTLSPHEAGPRNAVTASHDEHGAWKINWIPAITLAIFHLGAIAALFFFSWTGLILLVVTYWLTVGVGVGTCYHRLLTHRGYQVPKWLEYSLAVIATMALEGGPISWVALHRQHHQYSDRDGDPHSPREGMWWAHLLWMVTGASSHSETDALARYVPDLAKDRFYVLLSRYHWVPLTLATATVLAVFGSLHGWVFGFGCVLWFLCLRVTLGHHGTWFVNSATHKWGTRRYETRDDSRNSWWVALLTFGEGWHNNHHAHPTAARHGMTWYEIDMNWMHIWCFRMLGLAKKVQLVKAPSVTDAAPAVVAGD